MNSVSRVALVLLLITTGAISQQYDTKVHEVSTETPTVSTTVTADGSKTKKTTTEAPTSTSETPKTTTTVPSTSTTAPPSTSSTTAAPPVAPGFPHNVGSWNVTQNESPCIMVKAAIRISINYTMADSNETAIGKIDVPLNAKASGKCGKKQVLVLQWPSSLNASSGISNTIRMEFRENVDNSSSGGNFSIDSLSTRIHKEPANFPNASEPNLPFDLQLGENITGFVVPLNHSFKCDSQTEMKEAKSPLVVHLQESRIEAFRSDTGNATGFSEEFECSSDSYKKGSIFFGVLLGILIVVLILGGLGYAMFYFVRRRRRDGSGYQNM